MTIHASVGLVEGASVGDSDGVTVCTNAYETCIPAIKI